MIASGLASVLVLASPPGCVREAAEALARGQVEGAARRGEACFRVEGHARGLLLASQAWLQAGRLAHARLMARRFLALKTGVDRGGRKAAELVVTTAARGSGTVHLAIGPTIAPDELLGVAAAREGDGEALVLHARWDELLVDGVATLVLEPGAWVVTITRPGYSDRRLEITCALGQVTTLAADMTRAEALPPAGVVATTSDEVRRRRTWAIAAPAIGGPALIGGAAVVAVGLRGFAGVLGDMSCGADASVAGCRRPAAVWTERSGAGAATLGAGAGVLFAGLTGLVGDEGRRRRLWTAEAIAGGVIAGAGVALLAYGTTYFVTGNASERWAAGAVGRGENFYVTGFGLLGAGIGLAATAAGGLIADAVRTRRARRVTWRIVGGALRF